LRCTQTVRPPRHQLALELRQPAQYYGPAADAIKSAEFFNIELAPHADGRVYVSMTATTVDDQEPQLLTQEIARETVTTIDEAVAVIRAGLTSST
jgi:hypothetical protein